MSFKNIIVTIPSCMVTDIKFSDNLVGCYDNYFNGY